MADACLASGTAQQILWSAIRYDIAEEQWRERELRLCSVSKLIPSFKFFRASARSAARADKTIADN